MHQTSYALNKLKIATFQKSVGKSIEAMFSVRLECAESEDFNVGYSWLKVLFLQSKLVLSDMS